MTTSDFIEATDDVAAAYEELYAEGLTDGLPVIPPTRKRVEQMLEGTSRDPDESLGVIPPKYGTATVEKIAINAVMAGCRPAYMPVLIAAVEAMLEDEFNLYAVNATTHPAAPLLLVNGPIVDELNVNYGYNVFGQGWRANATIGRAVRLLLMNVGGGVPGELDRATQGHPGKFTFCIAENENKAPWEPFHARRGFDPSESTVTVFAAEAPHEINDHVNETATEILTIAASVFSSLGNNNTHHSHGEIMLVMGPEHAQTVADDGWDEQDVQWFLYDQARNPARSLQDVNLTDHYNPHPRFEPASGDAMIPLVEDPNDVLVVVAGGAGKHSMALPSFGNTRSVTKPIEDTT